MKKTTRYFDDLYARYNKRALCSPDPLQFLYDYPDKRDREITALTAACFAYGNVKQILKNLNTVFTPMRGRPRAFVLGASAAGLRWTFKDFKYRFTTREELCAFLLAVRRVLKKHGSLEACFLTHYSESDESVLPALRGLARELRAAGGLSSLVPDPDKNSALKRLNLFLRWMVRQDEVDPGGWDGVPASKLIIPLDVHMHRIARLLGLTKRNAADITTALEISRALKKHCPQDPVKYDFCLTRFGIRDDMDYKDL